MFVCAMVMVHLSLSKSVIETSEATMEDVLFDLSHLHC